MANMFTPVTPIFIKMSCQSNVGESGATDAITAVRIVYSRYTNFSETSRNEG